MTNGWLVVSIHDVAPATFTETLHWSADLDRRCVPCTLLVVPGPWKAPTFDPTCALACWLRHRAQKGDEIAQHGWVHRSSSTARAWRRASGWIAARGCAELWTDAPEVVGQTLRCGLSVLRAAGLEPIGVTPPGYLASRPVIDVMRDIGFHYTTSHRAVLDLRDGRRFFAPALSHRPGGIGERVGRALVVRGASHRAKHDAPVRLALHPDDLHRRGLRDAALQAIDAALDGGLQATTYERLVG
jgi:predicted deacetylase